MPAMDSKTGKQWYLVYTKPRQEKTAQINLERQDYRVYLPQIWNKPRNKPRKAVPMFPRYLFIHLDQSTDNWGPIRSTMGVISIVRFGMVPTAVPDSLIQAMQQRADSGGIVEYIGQEFRKGQSIRVKEGLFQGSEGIFLAKTGKERVAVLLQIMGQPARTVLADSEIEPGS